MKFVLFVEGHTEKALPGFLGRWLNPQLTQAVGVKVVRFDGAPDMIKSMPDRAKRLLNAPEQDIIAVFGLLDWHGLPPGIPIEGSTVRERTAGAGLYLERHVGHPKFRQHFAVHETEAWLLSQPGIFPTAVGAELADRARQPETVNDQEPPAKLLDRLYRAKTHKGYKKTVDGPNLLADLSPEEACEKCPHLKLMLEEMLHLARDIGR